MPRVLNSITVDAPTAPVSANVNDTFNFAGTPGFTGSGGVQRYDWKWEVDDGGGFVTIGASGTKLTTAGTNPVTNTNSQAQQSITVTCAVAGSYTIRMVGAPATGGNYTVISSTQTVEVAAASDNLLAEDVESAAQVTSPALGQEHVLAANDAQALSEVSTPALTEKVDLLAEDVQSTAEVGSPALGQGHALTAVSVESPSEVQAPTMAQIHALLADDAESISLVGSPALGQTHVLGALSVASLSEISAPTLAEATNTDDLLAEDIESLSQLNVPALAQIHALLGVDVESLSAVSMPGLGAGGGSGALYKPTWRRRRR